MECTFLISSENFHAMKFHAVTTIADKNERKAAPNEVTAPTIRV
jgi:hypothetical protein